MIIKKTDLVIDLITRDSSLIDVFNNHGFYGLENQYVLKQIGKLTLEELLNSKNKSVDIFVEVLNDVSNNEEVDITLSSKNSSGEIIIKGLLPCPVRIPLLEELNKLNEIDQVNHTLKAASEGLDWLKEDIIKAKSEEDLADIYISAGFDLFFEEELMKNSYFDNDNIRLKDPNHDYSMLAVVPAVFLVNTMVLGKRPLPKTWSDLLDPIYKGSISLPVSDFDLFNAILIHLYKEFGSSAIKTLGGQLIASMHPSQMVKSENRSRIKPAISIMPYFFTKMALPGSVMKAVWPEDGAIVSPIFMLTKKSKKLRLKPISDLFLSERVGEILSHKGLFPSVNKEIDNLLGNNKFKWIGWDYINENNIGEILKKCMNLFEEGMN
jgi:ABC-type Fe3+ transport system substrate-binding protein